MACCRQGVCSTLWYVCCVCRWGRQWGAVRNIRWQSGHGPDWNVSHLTTLVCMQTWKQKRVYLHLPTDSLIVHTHTCTHTHTHIHACMHTHTDMPIHTCTHTHACTHMQTHIYTHVHTHTHTHTLTYAPSLLFLFGIVSQLQQFEVSDTFIACW